MIPDRLQYFLDDFWNFEQITKSRPSDPALLIDYLAHLLLIYGLFMDWLPYRLQYFLDDFWNFEHFTESRPY